jgi:hypothetical protein
MFAEPVSKNWPRVWSESSRRLIASSSSGARWISSMAAGPSMSAMNPAGSARAVSAVASSSRLISAPGAHRMRSGRALADLAGPEYGDGAAVGQRFPDVGTKVAGEQACWHGQIGITMPGGLGIDYEQIVNTW